jgi:hypothetical protein
MMSGSQRGSNDAPAGGEDVPTVSQLSTTPGRFVFTEDDNSEGWIATDHVVSIDR